MTNRTLLRASIALFALLPATLAAPASARPITAQDLATLDRLAAPATSADGRWVAYQVTTTDSESYARNTGIYLLDTRTPGAAPMRIADLADASENSPAFSPDGKRLYFVSGKSGKDQLWFVSLSATASAMAAGAPVQASDMTADVSGFRLSPNGARVLVWGDIADSCASFGCAGNGDHATQGPGSARVYDQLFVRHWDAWETPGVHSRAFVFNLTGDGMLDTTPFPIAPGLIGDTPSKPFGGGEELAWSADSATVYFALRLGDRNEPLSTNLDIYAAPVVGGTYTTLTAANRATDTFPAVSPDGKTLAYAAMARPGYESDKLTIMLRDIATGTTRALTQGWDRSVASMTWSADGRSLIVTAEDTLETPAFSINTRTGAVTRLTERGSLNAALPLPGGALLYSISSVTSPPDLVLRAANGTTRRLTSINAARLAQIDPVHYEQFSFIGAAGDRVWGQVITPQGVTGKLPTVLMIHGGPQGSFNNSWSTRWNPMTWAAQGYAVVSVDFHGSTGYGQAFTDSINRDWGGKPLEDLRLGFAAAARTNAAIDTANACAAGGSYGGYMVNWIAGNWADGFKCLIQHDGVFDARAMAYETEELWFDEWEHGGHPYYDAPAEYERWNPVNHVAAWQTPMLVITGENDFRIPYTQGLASFTALQRRGIASRLVVFPDENHWVLKGRNSVQWHREVFGWINHYLRPSDAHIAPGATTAGR